MDEMHEDPRIQRLLEELRSTFAAAPGEHITQRHLSAMREAAGDAAGEAGWWGRLRERRATRRNPMPALTPRWLAAGVAVVFGLTGGLAAADVLPDPAQRVVARTVSNVGVDLPDPDDEADEVENGEEIEAERDGADPDANDHGQRVSDFVDETELEGCEKGQAVSDVASSNDGSDEPASERGSGVDPCEQGEKGRQFGEEMRERGQGIADERRPAHAGGDDAAEDEAIEEDDQGRPDDAGPPEDAGPPDGAGPPEGAGPPGD